MEKIIGTDKSFFQNRIYSFPKQFVQPAFVLIICKCDVFPHYGAFRNISTEEHICAKMHVVMPVNS